MSDMSDFSRTLLCALSLAALTLFAGCGEENTATGAACEGTDACYQDSDLDEIEGEPACLADRVPGGYCTHTCQTDADCCKADGECDDEANYVCSPLENSTTKYCFVTCEGADDAYCHEFAGEAFGCRSTGGGAQNRKVCLP